MALQKVWAAYVRPGGDEVVVFHCAVVEDTEHVWEHAQRAMEEVYGHRNVTCWTVLGDPEPLPV
jgi:hypothetical protein